MGYINFKEESYVANIQLAKRKDNNRKINELLFKNKQSINNYNPCEKYSFDIIENIFIGKEGILNEDNFYEIKKKDIICAKFIRCTFNNVKFKDCNLIGCYFEGCNLTGGGVVFENCNFIKEDSETLPVLNKKDNLSCYFNNCKLYCKFKMGKGAFLIFQNCILDNTNFENIDLSNMIVNQCEIKKVIMKDVNLSGAKFFKCYMEDFTFEDIDKSKLDEKTFFDKVKYRKRNREEYEGLYKYYEDLADKFLENNLKNNYGEYFYLCNKEKRKTLDIIPRMISDLYFVTCGYGERPWYAFITSLVLCAVFAVLFLCAGLEIEGQELKYSLQYFTSKSFMEIIRDYNKVVSISFSIFGGVGMEHKLNNQFGYIIENLEVLAGVVMIAIGAGALTRKIVR